MSTDSDTNQIAAYNQRLIAKYMCINTCKECYSCYMTNNQINCLHNDPTILNCNLLKLHGVS